MRRSNRITVSCKASELTGALAESIRVATHNQLDELLAGYERIGLTEEGMKAAEEINERRQSN